MSKTSGQHFSHTSVIICALDSFDLILMDGGKGQVNVALQVLEDLNLNIPVCGMVKDDFHRTRGLYFQNEEISIEKSSEAFRLITRIQDEAHRFAIEYHRQLRGKGQVHSILDDIEGIGPARRKALMRHYLSLDAIKAASIEELAKLPSMNEKAAQAVYNFFHSRIGFPLIRRHSLFISLSYHV